MESLSLLELNGLVRQCLSRGLPGRYWVQAELSEVRMHSAGHCYVEFVQKSERGGGLVARARGTIWSNTFRQLYLRFRTATDRDFTAGIKVCVQVSVTFHEQYGYSLQVHDIDPTYTLGDLALRRRQILQRLEADGVLELNKQLPFPDLPLRVAVISSASAAGYGDFVDQLQHNAGGYPFQVAIFPALMQGDRTEQSMLQALEQVMERVEQFDVVVIIRGGGATADLSAFDSYLLAAACAQFPLPIVTGIGHERDDTVLDLVAHTRVKTPTAAAQLLIGCMDRAVGRLRELTDRLHASAVAALRQHRLTLDRLRSRLPLSAGRSIAAQHLHLTGLQHRLEQGARQVLSARRVQLLTTRQRLGPATTLLLSAHRHRLELLAQRVADNSPRRLLALGYSITLGPDGRAVRDASTLKVGDRLRTRFHKGEAEVEVKSMPNQF